MNDQSWDGKTERRKNYPSICYQPVHESIEALRLDVQKISQLIELETKLSTDRWKQHQDSLEKHENTLYGNGKEGLTTIATKLKDSLQLHVWVIGIMVAVLMALVTKIIR